MSAARLRLFQQAYRDLDLFPLVEPEQIEHFRVSYGDRVLARLRSVVPASENQGHFILDLGDEFRWFQPSKTKIADAWNGAFSWMHKMSKFRMKQP